MKHRTSTILFLCIVSFSHSWKRYKRDNENNFIPLEEFEMKYRPLSAPLVLQTSNESSKVLTSGEEVKQSPNPCDPYITPKQEINNIGRRTSETKCIEYIWDLKVRHEKYIRESECDEEERRKYLKEHPEESDRRHMFGGRETYPGEFSHMGAIGWRSNEGTWIFKCGSSLISHNFVLTAAHCTSTSPRDTTVADIVPKIIRLGDKNIRDDGVGWLPQRDMNISRIIVHPQYESPKKYYDIALMELEENVIFTKFIQPACLWTKSSTSELGKQGTVTGWGVVESNRESYHPELLAANIDFLDSDICHNYLNRFYNRYFWSVADHQICAGVLTGGVDPCQGDSGGPLQVKIPLPPHSQGNMHYLVGVTSFGIKCGLEDMPGIYVRVSSFIDWIESIVWPNNTEKYTTTL